MKIRYSWFLTLATLAFGIFYSDQIFIPTSLQNLLLDCSSLNEKSQKTAGVNHNSQLELVSLRIRAIFGRLGFIQRLAQAEQAFNNDQDAASNNLIDTGLRPWQLDLLAQRMAELNQISQYNNVNSEEFGGFDRALRNGYNIKRQSRHRICYFNPVSCFKK